MSRFKEWFFMRIALGIEYNGTGLYGWQAQEGLLTVQGALEEALSRIADEPIKVFCAGRTDAGVHASGQVVHFDTEVIRPLRAWSIGVNTHLPPNIAVQWAHPTDDTFHARFKALARRYRYIIYNGACRPGILASQVTWIYRPLDILPMQLAAKCLIGELDFSSFRSSSCEAKSPMRTVEEIVITQTGDYITIEIQANAFLHHMVRNIVGSLLEIGSGNQPVEWLAEVLAAKDRRAASVTASPHGLYLSKVIYPESYGLPTLGKFML